jgi:asparagine synthase (glutamine-hydrolysing)
MSGIAGIFDLTGNVASESELRGMLHTLRHRGPDRVFPQSGTGVVLGHCALHNVAETAAAPLCRGELIITADARIDNREELIGSLGEQRTASDAELILSAYRKWGEDCPRHLTGDFAFAIGDERRQVLFCVRDHFGVKPFYYLPGARRFSFASEVKALLTLPEASGEIDEARIADFLAGLPLESQRTLYPDILRLPPRHSLSISRDGTRLREYWRLEPLTVIPASVSDEFLHLFESAVAVRLRGAQRVAAMLSGGLDSSSIASVAARLCSDGGLGALPTFSLVFDRTPQWSERPYIDAVLRSGDFAPFLIDADELSPFAGLDQALAEQDGPFQANGMAFSQTLYQTAADQGVRILLDGYGGDEVVSHGYGRLGELAKARRLLSLWREARGIANVHGDKAWRVFSGHMRRSGGRVGRIWNRLASTSAKAPRPAWEKFINPDFANRTATMERFRDHRRAGGASFGSEAAQHASVLRSNRVSQSFEILDKAAAARGIEPRYPFWDRRLVEFCLSIPSEEKLAEGWSRLVLRRAVKGIVPESVRWRRDKLDFGPHLIRGMLEQDRGRIERTLGDRNALGAFVNLTAVAAAYRRIADKRGAADGNDVQAVWRTMVLAEWMNRRNGMSDRRAA